MIGRARRKAAVYGLLATCALVAFVFLLVALHAWLASMIGPAPAALVIAGTALTLGGSIYLWMRLSEAAAHRRQLERRRRSGATAVATSAALTVLPLLFKVPALRAAAIPAGLLVGYLMATRRRGNGTAGLNQPED